MKYKFAPEDQDLSKHLPCVQQAIIAEKVSAKRHVSCKLKDVAVQFYINPATSEFWYNGKELTKVASIAVTALPSEDHQVNISDAVPTSSGRSSGIQRQNAVETGKFFNKRLCIAQCLQYINFLSF